MEKVKRRNKAIATGVFLFTAIVIVSNLIKMIYLSDSVKAELWKEIVYARPSLQYEKSEFEKVNIICDYVYENTPFAQNSQLVIDQMYPAKHIYADEMGEYYTMEYYRKILNLDDTLGGGYYCGGMAEVLSEIYGVLGYNSCVLGLILKNEEGTIVDGHAVSLVYVDGKWIIEDPTFNVHFVNQKNEAIGIKDLRENIGIGNISLEHGDSVLREYISADGNYSGVYDVYGDCIKKNSFYYYKINTDVDRYKECNYEHWKGVMEKDGYNIAYESLFMYPTHIYIPKSQKYNDCFDINLYTKIIEELNIDILVDFRTY